MAFAIRHNPKNTAGGVELKYTDPTPEQQRHLVACDYYRKEVIRAFRRRKGKITHFSMRRRNESRGTEPPRTQAEIDRLLFGL